MNRVIFSNDGWKKARKKEEKKKKKREKKYEKKEETKMKKKHDKNNLKKYYSSLYTIHNGHKTIPLTCHPSPYPSPKMTVTKIDPIKDN